MGRPEVSRKKPNAKFFVRILPSLDFAVDSIKIESNSTVMHVKSLQNSVREKKMAKKNFWRFITDGIFYNRSQEEVYNIICDELVEKAIKGVNSVIIAYGQSGSGKTFTISGLRHHYEDRGLLLRLLSSFCKERDARRDLLKFSMSYVEFLHYEVRDLFNNRSIIKFNEIKKRDIDDEIDAWKLIFDAEVRKSFDHKAPFAGSDRGHTVFTLHVESISLTESHPTCTSSKVQIVDMAGIDCGNAPMTWKCISDVGYSNLSKTFFEQLILCIKGKSRKSSGCGCQFKTNKLLKYLQDTIRPFCLIRFVGHIIGNENNLPLTLSVLRFGHRVRGFQSVELEPCLSNSNPLLILKVLEAEVEQMRAELYLKNILDDSTNYSNISQDKLLQIRRAVTNFLNGNLDKLTLLSFGQVEITLDIFKEIYERSAKEKEQAVKEAVLAAIEEIQLQLSPDKINGVSFISSGHTRTPPRRHSRQRDQLVSTTVTQRLKSSETSSLGAQPSRTVTAQVGQVDTRGIPIGIGKSSPNFEGQLTKAVKKARRRKSDTIVRPGPKYASLKDRVMQAPKDYIDEDYHADLPEKVPSTEGAWQCFYSERSDIIQGYQEEMSKMEENIRISRKNYAMALCDLGKAKDALERTKRDWEEWKHAQNIRKHSMEEEEEQEEKDETFVSYYSEELQKREIEVDKAAENCHVTLIDLRNNIEELAEEQAVLENEFQMFCEDTYKIAIIPPDLNHLEYVEKNDELEVMNEIRKEMYSQFRQKILNYIPKKKKTKWVKLF